MSKPTRIKWAVADQMMKKAAHDDNSEYVVMKFGRFYYDISNCTEEEVLEFLRESQVRSINKKLREKLMKNVRVIKGYPSNGLAMQFHVPDTPDGENYIFQIDEEFWQEIVKEIEKAKLEARIDEHTMVRDKWASPGIVHSKTTWSINRLKELYKLQEEDE